MTLILYNNIFGDECRIERDDDDGDDRSFVCVHCANKVHSARLSPSVVELECYDTTDLLFVPQLVQLEVLSMLRCTQELPPQLAQLTRLTRLHFAHDEYPIEFAPHDAHVIESLTTLRALSFGEKVCPVVDAIDWTHMQHITGLDVSVTPRFRLKPLTALRELYIKNTDHLCNATDLRLLTQLTSLTLFGNKAPYPLRLDTHGKIADLFIWTVERRCGRKKSPFTPNLGGVWDRREIYGYARRCYREARTHVSRYLRALHGWHPPIYVVAEILDYLPECRFFALEELIEFARRMYELPQRLLTNKRGLRATPERKRRVLNGQRVYK